MRRGKRITQKELREVLDYDPNSGEFKWKVRAGGMKAGRVAGYMTGGRKTQYRGITIFGVHYYAHKLAWLYVYGQWPKHQIDHINRIPTDNRISNLRDAPHSVNQRNRSLQKNNKSGCPGVFYQRACRKWQAQARDGDGKKIHLGTFDTIDLAIKARMSAESKYGYIRPLGESKSQQNRLEIQLKEGDANK